MALGEAGHRVLSAARAEARAVVGAIAALGPIAIIYAASLA